MEEQAERLASKPDLLRILGGGCPGHTVAAVLWEVGATGLGACERGVLLGETGDGRRESALILDS